MLIELPISKSIANRLLILQAIHGDGLMPVSATLPEDVQILHRALTTIKTFRTSKILSTPCVDVGNCGTAMRFLTAYAAQLENKITILDGVERMHHRPIGQLVDALREIGADIEYLGEEGFPPLRIKGCILDKHRIVTLDNPQSTQFVSALLLIGANVQTNSTSPYITLTRAMIEQWGEDAEYISPLLGGVGGGLIERDWSSAAFWYEYIALYGGEITLPGLSLDSLQGDKVVADIFAQLGVTTQYTEEGIQICRSQAILNSKILIQNFSACPDLYPAVALTCERLGVALQATGIDFLPLKESDRLRAVREHRTDADHRMAMALLIAGYEVDDTACISKSYPQFLGEYRKLKHPNITIVIPRRGINDEGKGKKHALYRLISAVQTEYVWMLDDDVISPVVIFTEDSATSMHRSGGNKIGSVENKINLDFLPKGHRNYMPDLLILPLRMESEREKPSLLERLQIAEYAAIQQLTIETAKRGHAVMCSGANLIAKRDRWLESYSDLHPEIPSGDDMFLLESFKRRGLKIAVSESEELTAIVRPHTEWRAFFRQRMRWAGKAPKYTDKDILLCGAIILMANLLQLLCPLVLLVKFPMEYSLIKKRDHSVSLSVAILLELLYPWYLLISLIGGLFRRQW
ncbi:MAG: glycosyltransferase [Paludibacteraceae bacterium]|nr:glycosyltransferase [Paludibacteraceae bacterium]